MVYEKFDWKIPTVVFQCPMFVSIERIPKSKRKTKMIGHSSKGFVSKCFPSPMDFCQSNRRKLHQK